jgi:hypothetical protein
MKTEIAKKAVVQIIGGGCRGFIVGAGGERFVITVAHSAPHDRLPAPYLANSSELTFDGVIGPLFSEQGTITAELCVYSLVDDIAVFGAPDTPDDLYECAEYEQFTATAAMTVGKLPDRAAPPKPHPSSAAFNPWLEERQRHDAHTEAAFILSLDGEWEPCTVRYDGRYLMICEGADQIRSGMSGSPIIDINGDAIGLVSTRGGKGNLNPSLIDCLPPWLLRKLGR